MGFASRFCKLTNSPGWSSTLRQAGFAGQSLRNVYRVVIRRGRTVVRQYHSSQVGSVRSGVAVTVKPPSSIVIVNVSRTRR